MIIMKVLGIVTILTLSLLFAVPASADVNLLQNPGFEGGKLYPWVSFPSVAASIVTPGHSGLYAAHICVVDGVTGGISQSILYQCASSLDFWYKGGGAVSIIYSDGWVTTVNLIDTSEWRPFHIALHTTKQVYRVDVDTLNYVYVDDFDLEACIVGAPEFGLELPLLISMAVAPLMILLHRRSLRIHL